MKWIVADTETTGLGEDARMVEVAWAQIDEDLEALHSDSTLLNPECPIPAAATAIHGISDEHVAGAPTADQYFYGTLGGNWLQGPLCLIAHNVAFDARFLSPYLPSDVELVCTWRLARKLYPGRISYKLQALGSGLDLLDGDERFHSAAGDLDILHRLLRCMRDQHGLSLEEMLNLSQLPLQIDTMPFGKHKGARLQELPRSYVRWLLGLPDLDKDLRGALLAL